MRDITVTVYDKIGGLLYVVAFGLVGSIAMLIVNIATKHVPLFVDGSITTLLSAPAGMVNPLIVPFIFAEILGNLFFLGFAIYLLVQLAKRAPRFPRNMIIFYLSHLAFIILDLAAIYFVFSGQFIDDKEYQTIIRAIVTCAIWIPYFLLSKRVKGTFIQRAAAESVTESEGALEG